MGAVAVVVGMVASAVERNLTMQRPSVIYTVLCGLFWSAGTACIAIALRHYNAQISRLAPLYNMNTLVTVVLGVIVFAEWQNLSTPRLVVAAVLIVIGGVLAATA